MSAFVQENAPVHEADEQAARTDWKALFANSCTLIAPTWPLDQFIAVNPYWEVRHMAAEDAAARFSALGRIHLLSPEALRNNAFISASHDERADDADARRDQPGHWLNISDLVDQRRDLKTRMSWHDEIVEQISRFCARYFADEAAVSNDPQDMYATWLDGLRHDAGVAVLMAEPAVSRQFTTLPDSIDGVFANLADETGLAEEAAGAYAHALLLDINGWAAWGAYLRWQSGLLGEDNHILEGLLAIRMAWELLLWRHVQSDDAGAGQQIRFFWRSQQAALPRLIDEHRSAQAADWRLQRASEHQFQQQFAASLMTANPPRDERPLLQAVFCIDVRSEGFRRQLEAQHPAIQTIGFAGFFGLPIDFQATDSAVKQPQLPGLLAPSLSVTESGDAAGAAARRRGARWSEVGDAAPAMFGLVEALGLTYAWRLLERSFLRRTETSSATTALALVDEQGELTAVAKAELLKGVLGAMGLREHFAETIMLVGHGSSSCNNPHAASLDCGACGGRSGEVNVRILAQMLNDPEVRSELIQLGVTIPAGTQFLPALHDTTLDEVHCLEGARCPAQVEDWLQAAGSGTRHERPHGRGAADNQDLAEAALKRSRDWSEVRPEWGLAGNAAFVAAPRSRTRHLDLEGRVFLHDYDHAADADNSLLELIMTAPMVVANWINMQYNASVADNLHFGSGSKTLHNVVGGRLGVLEGQGGDLRIGLPMQSLHDGQQWMHQPLRLSVYLEAPREDIAGIYQKHDVVRQLVDNNWLYLFQIGEDGIQQLYQGVWQPPHHGGAEL